MIYAIQRDEHCNGFIIHEFMETPHHQSQFAIKPKYIHIDCLLCISNMPASKGGSQQHITSCHVAQQVVIQNQHGSYRYAVFLSVLLALITGDSGSLLRPQSPKSNVKHMCKFASFRQMSQANRMILCITGHRTPVYEIKAKRG